MRSEGKSEPSRVKIQELLKLESGIVVRALAEICVEWDLRESAPWLVEAYDRLLLDRVKVDSQCYGKISILRALKDLNWGDCAVFELACETVQLEAIWGGKEDTAAPVRQLAMAGLLGCTGMTTDRLYLILGDRLADPEWKVREASARALGAIGQEVGLPLLRLRALAGDYDIRVIGACLEGVLGIQKERGLEFLTMFAEREGAIGLEAKCVMAGSGMDFAIKKAAEYYFREVNQKSIKAMQASFAVSGFEDVDGKIVAIDQTTN